MSATQLKAPQHNAPKICQLPDGLTIVAEQMPVEAVNLNVWLNVGSVVEPDAINGMAHFLEHMVFKGTPNLQAGEFDRVIEERGAMMNAATSQDYTHYFITTAPKDFAELAPLQLDVACHPSIPDEEFERERLVVLEEICRAEDNPKRRTFRRAMETCFERLPYRRQVLGSASAVSELTPGQMRDFHAHWYQPEAMTVAAVGNLPVEELIATVADSWDEKSQTSRVASEPAYLQPESPFTEIVRQEYVDESLQQARLVMVWRVPGMTELPETYALDVLSAILGQGKMSRLLRDLREKRDVLRDGTLADPQQRRDLALGQPPIAQHLRRLQAEPVAESDLARICTQVANRYIFGSEKPSNRAYLYSFFQSQLGDLAPALHYPQSIQAIEAADVQAAAQRYLSPDAYGVVVMRPA
ncbi:MAG: peptidase M16 [Cyanobacteria bacterium SW_8_48_13]|nr:MAG: peptidase M16 [Cyanobacteria bacterium SW_8_48_13]